MCSPVHTHTNPSRGFKWSSTNARLTVEFIHGLYVYMLISEQKYCDAISWHQMSLLRPGMIILGQQTRAIWTAIKKCRISLIVPTSLVFIWQASSPLFHNLGFGKGLESRSTFKKHHFLKHLKHRDRKTKFLKKNKKRCGQIHQEDLEIRWRMFNFIFIHHCCFSA